MEDNKLYFIGLLANTDKSILKLNLSNGFQIKQISFEDVFNSKSILGAFLHMKGHHEAHNLGDLYSSDSKSFFCVTKSIAKNDDDIGKHRLSDEAIKLCNESNDLHDTFGMMRLYKEGNIHMPISYIFDIINREIMGLSTYGSILYHSRGPLYMIEDNEIAPLHEFLNKAKLPFKDYLQLAFEHFEFSYHTHNLGMQFISLMTGLEILFINNERRKKTNISIRASALLGMYKNDARTKRKKLLKLYDKRSDIVHSGDTRQLSLEDVLLIRDFLRNSIRNFYTLDADKFVILDALDEINTSSTSGRKYGFNVIADTVRRLQEQQDTIL